MIAGSYEIPPGYELWPSTALYRAAPLRRSWCDTVLSGQFLAILLICLAIVALVLSCRTPTKKQTHVPGALLYGAVAENNPEYAGAPVTHAAAADLGEPAAGVERSFDKGYALGEARVAREAGAEEVARAFLGSELERADALSGQVPPAIKANSDFLDLGAPGIESTDFEAAGVTRAINAGGIASVAGGADIRGAYRNSAETEELFAHPKLAPVKRARVMPASWRNGVSQGPAAALSPEAQEFTRYAITAQQVEEALQHQGTMRLGENSRLNLSRLGSRSLIREIVAGNPGPRRLSAHASVVPFNDSDPHELSITQSRV